MGWHTGRVSQLTEHHAHARYVGLPGARVAVLDAAQTSVLRGTALLVPGFAGSKEDFAPVLDPLGEAGYRTVALDLPGQYQSPGPADRAAYTIDWLGSVVGDLARTLSEEPVHLLGHSVGGLVARAAVLADPGRYRSLVLLCSGPGAPERARAARLAELEPHAAGGMATVWAAAVERDGPPDVPADQAEFLRRRFLAASVAGYFGLADAVHREADRTDALHGTGVPALVCFGEQDTGWPLAAQREMAGRLDANVAMIAGAGHCPAIDRPTQTAAALTTFWSAHGGGVR
jgi:pimeloyl-ACP methyl ester carboxylesterase